MTNQSDLQQSIRDITGTSLDYNGDWSALFDLDGIPAGDWNGRLLAWINFQLGTSYTNLPEAQNAYAVENGAMNWSALNTGDVIYDTTVISATRVIRATTRIVDRRS